MDAGHETGPEEGESANGPKPAANGKARVLVVHDNPVARLGIVGLLNRQPDLVCCGLVGMLAEIIPAVGACQPDLVLLDLCLKDDNSLQLIAPLRVRFPSVGVLVLSQCDEVLCAEQALRAGACGYVMKGEAPETIVGAIRSVLRGEIYVSEKLAGRLLLRFIGGETARDGMAQPTGVDSLTDREFQVFNLIGSGMSTREIARELTLSIKTVETYRAHLKRKLALPDAAALAHCALQFEEGQPARPQPPA